MTTTATAPPAPPRPTPPLPQQDWAASALAPAAAGLATLCASTALTGVIAGGSWLVYVAVAVVLVECAGLVLRMFGTPSFVVGVGQLLVLMVLVTSMFTESAILGLLPGPAALGELGDVLTAAGDEIRTGLPPVDATPPILCLAMIGIGMVAVLVDTFAVTVAAPAASGLVLLCLYAVPASLATEMLPWWSFVLGASAFAALIALEGGHRHRRWRGRRRPSDQASAGVPAAIVGVAVVLGLAGGAVVTAIGTVGRLPGVDSSSASFKGGLGLKPFTELRGLLNDRGESEVFRVRGLGPEEKYPVRAFTLDTFEPERGWRLPDPMPPGVPVTDEALPKAPGDVGGKAHKIWIEPVRWRDVWLPIYGVPRHITGVGDGWYYDRASGIVYRTRSGTPPDYQVIANMTQPTAGELGTAQTEASTVPAAYTAIPGIDRRVQELTNSVVAGKQTPFAKADALWKFFTDTTRFTYDTRTADRSDSDALADFLLKGKRGFCAQFASSMAVMLRLEGIPARVAVGFTAGRAAAEGFRSITTKDAHAWVEAYFGPRLGWVSFDPTPRDDGRGFTPPYLGSDAGQRGGEADRNEVPTQQPTAPPEATPEPPQDRPDEPEQTGLAQAPGWVSVPAIMLLLLAIGLAVATILVARQAAELRTSGDQPDDDARRLALLRKWLPPATAAGGLLALGLLGWLVSWWLAVALLIVAAIAAGPALVRDLYRGRRLYEITLRQAKAPEAAWQELLDDCADRGIEIDRIQSVREIARQLVRDGHVDEQTQPHLDVVVQVLEQSWYGPAEDVDLAFAAAFEHLRRSLQRTMPRSMRASVLPASVVKR